jgi:hypothetical protein
VRAREPTGGIICKSGFNGEPDSHKKSRLVRRDEAAS